MATAKLPFSAVGSDFKAKSRQTFSNMQARFSEKRNKHGRIIRIGRELPFDLEQFRAWLLTWLGSEGGVVRCSYCSAWLDISTIVVDHRVPVNRGGDLGLDNLAVCCKSDNDIKGQLTESEYCKLIAFLQSELAGVAEQNIKQRLASAVQLAAQQRWQIIQRAKQAKKQTAPLIDSNERLLPNTNDFDEDF